MTIASGEGQGTRILLEVPLMENDLDQNPVPVKICDEPAAERGEDGAIRVLVADDHAIVRQGLTNLLEEDPRFVVVGEAGDGEEAVRAVEKDRPDVLLLDVNMPRMNGIEVAREVSRRWPDVIVVGLSVQDDETTARAMIEAGASAFLSKAGESERMFATLTDLMAQRAGGADN
jgi:DNA-binding NarL/FixJ family response regulator